MPSHTETNPDEDKLLAESPSGSIPSRTWLRRVLRLVLWLVVLSVLASGYVYRMRPYANSSRSPMWDEYGWVAASRSTFDLMILKRDFREEQWQSGFQATTYGSMNPNFGKLVMGLALYLCDYDLEPPTFFPALGPGHPRFDSLSSTERMRIGSPHIPYVQKMRYLVFGLGTGCGVLTFLVGRSLGGWLLGAGAYVAYIFTHLVEQMAFTVYTDNLLLLMGLLSIWATAYFVRWWSCEATQISWGGLCARGFLLACLYGATVATKFNGVSICIACVGAVAVLWMAGRFRHRGRIKTLATMVAVGIASFAVFLLINPQYWGNTPQKLSLTMEKWDKRIAKQQRLFAGRFTVDSLDEKVAKVYEKSVVRCGPLGRHLHWAPPVLVGLGFVVTCWRWLSALRHKTTVLGPCLLLAWTATVVVMTTLWLPLDWPRYYLPLVPVFCLLQAVPIEATIGWIGGTCVRKRATVT